MTEIPRIAVVTTRDRPHHLADLAQQLGTQRVELIVVVDNLSDPPVMSGQVREASGGWSAVAVKPYDSDPPNLYAMWNVGLRAATRWATEHAYGAWDVGLFNDDATLPAGWFDAVASAMRAGSAGAASGDAHGHIIAPHIATRRGEGSIVTRMCPWAFIIRGELGIFADEDYGWWYGDTDLEWRVREQHGGVLVLPGLICGNTCANSTTVGALAEQAGRDAETFARKWGGRPW